MKILAIDPGNTESAHVVMNPDYSISGPGIGKYSNDLTLVTVQRMCGFLEEELIVVIEKVASYGMAVGAEVFETCVWIGRFAAAASNTSTGSTRSWPSATTAGPGTRTSARPWWTASRSSTRRRARAPRNIRTGSTASAATSGALTRWA